MNELRIYIVRANALKMPVPEKALCIYEGWNFNSGNYLFTTDTK